MQMNREAEQLSLFAQDGYAGKTCPAHSVQETPKGKTSGSSSRRLSESNAIPLMSLNLTPGHGNLLGESYWEMISPWRGGFLTANYVQLNIIELRQNFKITLCFFPR